MNFRRLWDEKVRKEPMRLDGQVHTAVDTTVGIYVFLLVSLRDIGGLPVRYRLVDAVDDYVPTNEFTILQRFTQPAAAHRWAGKDVLILQNNRNRTRNILVLNKDNTPHDWPTYMDGRVTEIVKEVLSRD